MSRTLAFAVAIGWIVAGWTVTPARGEVASTLPVAAAIAQAAPTPAAVVGLAGRIDDFNRDSFFKRFKTAKADGAKTIIVEIDTWGGLVNAALDISRFLKSQSDVHTIAYVNDRAISAGAMIAMACDEIVMKNVATLGDCAPISRTADGAWETMGAAERAKAQSPISADFYESALRNHHDPLLSEAMVVSEVVVYWVEDPETGQRRFVEPAEYAKLTAAGWKDVPGVKVPLDAADKLLTVGTDQALMLGLATGKANSVEQLAADRHLNITETLHSGMGEAAVAWLNGGIVRMVLIMIFLSSIYAALHAPGHGTAEALAVTTLGLLLGVPLLAGYATWWEIILILGGLAMIAFEVFVFPHAGIMIVGGVLMMVLGLVMTFVGGDPGGFRLMPHLAGNVAALKNGLGYVIGGVIGSALVCTWLSRYLPKMPYFNKLVLTTVSGGPATPSAPSSASVWPPVGSVGRAVTPLGPGGSAEFPTSIAGDYRVFSVVSESGYLAAGSPVIVREVGGGRLVVESTVS